MREEILLKRIRAGDGAALEELIRLYYPEILKYCKWHAPDSFLAEDAAQETFIKAVRYLESCRFSGKFRAFLYKIASNTCIDMKRSRCRKDESVEELEVEIGYEEPGFASLEEEENLKGYVRRLDAECQEIVLLRFGQDLKLKEIAEIMDLPMRTVQSKLRKGLKQIEKEWKEEN